MRPSNRSSPVALPGFSMLMGRREEPFIPLHYLHMAMYTIWAYLLPCNHCKACQETKWTIGSRAPPANSKQISKSIEARFNSGTSCVAWDGKWATTHDSTLFGPEVSHTSCQDRLLCLTRIVSSSDEKHFQCQNNKEYIPILCVLQLTDGLKQG